MACLDGSMETPKLGQECSVFAAVSVGCIVTELSAALWGRTQFVVAVIVVTVMG